MRDRPEENHVLVAGVTTRALAVSAARAGYRVTAVDAFGDRDLRAVAEVILAHPRQDGRPYGPMEAAAAGSAVPARFAAYTSNFENYPAAVARLGRGRRLLGNRPAVLARVRDPMELMRALRRHGLVAPESRTRGPDSRFPSVPWLLKTRRSGGGHGVAPWIPGAPVPRSKYLQQQITGIPGSVSFVADGANAVVLGFSRQLVGDKAFGAGPFRYCGSIVGSPPVRMFPRQEAVLAQAARAAQVLTEEFGLLGLNGIDFIARNGVPFPIEVNPRYSASMELIEQAGELSLFALHARACDGELPLEPRTGSLVRGKAIVFARQDGLVGRSQSWLRRGWLADIPHPGEYISKGRPICTVFAQARYPRECRRLLAQRARMIYRAMKPARKQAA